MISNHIYYIYSAGNKKLPFFILITCTKDHSALLFNIITLDRSKIATSKTTKTIYSLPTRRHN